MGVLQKILNARVDKQTLLAQLIDPDYIKEFDQLVDIVQRAKRSGVDLFFFGGSLVTNKPSFDIVKAMKEISDIPVTLFPSTPHQIDKSADAILFLSLLSGRNPEYLIGHHVAAAPLIRKSNLEIIPTGYLLISCGKPTTAEYVSNTASIPYDKPEIAASTALAGQYLGMKSIYLDGGSGAEKPIDPLMVKMVREWTNLPIIVGGGIKNTASARELSHAGADVLVIGNGAEERPELLSELKAKMK